jgi:hypothetical protein
MDKEGKSQDDPGQDFHFWTAKGPKLRDKGALRPSSPTSPRASSEFQIHYNYNIGIFRREKYIFFNGAGVGTKGNKSEIHCLNSQSLVPGTTTNLMSA